MDDLELDEAEVKAKVAALFISDDATRRGIICGLVGHSRIVDDSGDGADYQVTCARCGWRVNWKNGFDAHGAVFRRHIEVDDCAPCATCATNRKTLTWRDTWEVQLGQTDGRI